MKRYSTSYVIKEMQIKTIMRYHFTPIRIAKIQNTDNTKCWQGCGATGTLIHCWWECKMVQPLWQSVWQFVTKLNILLPYHPAISYIGIYPKVLKTYIHTNTCAQMFIAALFIIAKTWKPPRCPLVGEWVNKQWYIQTMKCYSVLRRNELSSCEKTWKNLKQLLLSERSQFEKATYCMIPAVWHSGKAKLQRQ